jgi:hypothetical protein
MRSVYLPSFIPLLAAVVAGLLVRFAGEVEGRLPTGGVLPVVVSAALCLLLWVGVWRTTRSVYPPLRLALVAIVPFLIGATAGVLWATYGVVPGSALAVIAVLIAIAIRR